MVSLTRVDRGQDSATFSFVITKISTDPPPATQDPTLNMVVMVVTDDHGNDYKQALNYVPQGSPAEFVSNLPVGFQYKISVSLPVPRAAPIVKLRMGVSTSLVDVDLSKQVRLLTMKEFGNASLSRGSSLTVTRFQKVSFGSLSPGIYNWYIPMKIENSDYNDGPPMSVQVLSQLGDGEVFVLPSQDIPTVRGLASSVISVPVPRILAGQPFDQTLLFFFKDKTTGAQVVRFWSAKSTDFPPRVGQGTGSGESLFINAYQKEGGPKVMGDPLALPRWLGGGGSPKSAHDVLIQEFPSVSAFGASVVLWDKQNSSDTAYVIHGVVWDRYLALGGFESWLGYPIGNVTVSTEGHALVDFERGYIGTNNGFVFEPFEYPSGRLAYDCGDAICVVDLDTKGKVARAINKKQLVSGASSPDAALSPDGTLLAYGHDTDYWWGGGVCRADGSDCVEQRLRQPQWSPDGTKLAFQHTSSTGGGFSATWYYRLKVMNSDGTDMRTILTSTSGAMTRDDFYNPAWSPDVKKLAFRKDGKEYKVNLDGTGLQEVSPDMRKTLKLGSQEYILQYSEPWIQCVRGGCSSSPDGVWLAIATTTSYPYERWLYLVGPGSRVYNLQLPGWKRGVPSWSRIGAAPSPPQSKKATPTALSEAGLRFIAQHEGFRPTLYDDPAGHCTIGYGHLVHRGKCDSTEPEEFRRPGGISEQRALELLKADAAVAERVVSTSVTVPMNQAQFDALVSFTYNLGEGNLRQSDLLKKLNAGDYDAVPAELNRWVFAGEQKLAGLVERRRDEGVLFKEGRYGTSATSAVGPAIPRPTEASVKGIPSLVELQPLECKLESSYRSSDGGSSTSILFTNETRQSVNTYWLDYAGRRRHYMTLEPGKEYVQQTYVGHPWLVVGASEQCLAIYQPSERPARAVIQ